MKDNYPFMTNKEVDFISSILNENDIVLEYGAGSSTLYFSQYVKKYYSIEHTKAWCDTVSSQAQNNTHVFHGKCFFGDNNVHCDYSIEDHKIKWQPYCKKVHELPCSKYDKILIDGRARAYCAIEVLDYLDLNGLLMIHDYSYRRKYHSIVESLYTKVNIVDSLAVFSKK